MSLWDWQTSNMCIKYWPEEKGNGCVIMSYYKISNLEEFNLLASLLRFDEGRAER